MNDCTVGIAGRTEPGLLSPRIFLLLCRKSIELPNFILLVIASSKQSYDSSRKGGNLRKIHHPKWLQAIDATAPTVVPNTNPPNPPTIIIIPTAKPSLGSSFAAQLPNTIPQPPPIYRNHHL